MTWLSGWFKRTHAESAAEFDVSWGLLRSLRSRDVAVQIAVISATAGHRPTGLADAFGGYLCACRAASWSDLNEYGPWGGCPQGWYAARTFLERHAVPSEDAIRRHHEFGHRNGLTPVDLTNASCQRFNCGGQA